MCCGASAQRDAAALCAPSTPASALAAPDLRDCRQRNRRSARPSGTAPTCLSRRGMGARPRTRAGWGSSSHSVRAARSGPARQAREERRLFYVALTRARRGTYLVADSLRPSEFVSELLRESSGLRSLGQFKCDQTPACPRCRTGRLAASRSGRSLGCLNFPFCRYRAPRCQTCGRGFVVIMEGSSHCTDASCDASPPVCSTCDAGVMVARNGPRGRFLGCTQYASDQPCKNTQSTVAPGWPSAPRLYQR